MFKFLKEKLSNVVKKFSKEVEEEAEIIEKPVTEEKPVAKKEEPSKKKVAEEKPKKKEPEKTTEKPPKKEPDIVKEEKKEPIIIKKEPVVEEPDEIVEEEKKEPVKEEISEDEDPETTKEIPSEEKPKEKKGFLGLFKKKEEPKPEIKEEKAEEKPAEKQPEEKKPAKVEEKKPVEEKKEPPKVEEKKPHHEEEKKGFFGKVSETFTKIQLSQEKFDELFWDIEITLMENNVAVEVVELIKKDLKEELTTGKISRKNVQEIIIDTLRESLDKVLSVQGIDLDGEIKKKKPFIISVIGVNGSGKTTAIAKLTHLLKKKGYSVVLAAADTFRAAAIQQLEEHSERLGVKMIKHDYNSDPAAVAFDAVKHAEAKGIDVVLIDTAGRMHSNDNLMQELKKLIRVNKPDLKLFVGESITGNDCVEQAKKYNEEIGIDAIILTKADVDEKGGAAISISHVTGKPILYIGTGQTYDDLEPFNKQKILTNVGL